MANKNQILRRALKMRWPEVNEQLRISTNSEQIESSDQTLEVELDRSHPKAT